MQLKSQPGPVRVPGVNRAKALAGVACCCLALLGTPACTTNVERQHTVEYTPQRILEDQRRQEAEIAAEARGPTIPAADYKRLIAVMQVKRERTQREAAQFAKFQFEQKLALASASSPKLLIAGEGGIPANYRQVDYSGNRTRRQITYTGGASRGYPDKFYQRQIQEESAVQAESEYNEAARASASDQPSEGDSPYAIPVPGRPGFVTMPPKMGGYIDVRGYAPGSYVMDPWTKSIIRVP
jgi:hypothetical protein